MTRDELHVFINSTRQRIAEYRSHDLCDMELDCAFACSETSLAVYDDLLYHDGNLTPVGIETITTWAQNIAVNTDLTASEHGLVETADETEAA